MHKGIRQHGFWGCAAIAALIPYNRGRRRLGDWAFDRRWGVDTGGSLNPKGREDLASFATKYQGTPAWLVKSAIHALPIRLEGVSFYDLGCGKGRVLLVAAKYPFRRIVGVEFSPELAGIARMNVVRVAARMKEDLSHVSVICGDAGDHQFPDEPAVVFLCNPFREPIMRRVVGHLLRLGATRECYVVYIVPLLASLFNNEHLFSKVKSTKSYTIWKVNRRS